MKDFIFPVVLVLVAIFVGGITISQRQNCTDHGGTFVKTTFWYKCIGDK